MKKKRFWVITAIIVVLTGFIGFSITPVFKTSERLTVNPDDTIKNNPQIDIKVNKEYDENGNVIRYDSSYTYIYRNTEGDLEQLNMDSLFNSFRPYFSDNTFDIMRSPFERFFDEDTLYQQHFFEPDFFMQQFDNQMFRFEDMMKEMDSLRNMFLKDLYPEMEQYKNTKPKKEDAKGLVNI